MLSTALVSLLLLGGHALADEASGSGDNATLTVGTTETTGNNTGDFEATCDSCSSSTCTPLKVWSTNEFTGLCGPSEYSYVRYIEISTNNNDAFSYITYTNSDKAFFYKLCTNEQSLCSARNTNTCGYGAMDNPVVVIKCENRIYSCNLMADITFGCASFITDPPTTAPPTTAPPTTAPPTTAPPTTAPPTTAPPTPTTANKYSCCYNPQGPGVALQCDGDNPGYISTTMNGYSIVKFSNGTDIPPCTATTKTTSPPSSTSNPVATPTPFSPPSTPTPSSPTSTAYVSTETYNGGGCATLSAAVTALAIAFSVAGFVATD